MKHLGTDKTPFVQILCDLQKCPTERDVEDKVMAEHLTVSDRAHMDDRHICHMQVEVNGHDLGFT